MSTMTNMMKKANKTAITTLQDTFSDHAFAEKKVDCLRDCFSKTKTKPRVSRPRPRVRLGASRPRGRPDVSRIQGPCWVCLRPRWFSHLEMATDPSTNRDQRRVTLLMWSTTLPVYHYAKWLPPFKMSLNLIRNRRQHISTGIFSRTNWKLCITATTMNLSTRSSTLA